MNEKKVEEINYQSYPLTDNRKKIYKKKDKTKMNEVTYFEKKEKNIKNEEEKTKQNKIENNIENKNFDVSQKNYFFSYDESLNVHNYTQRIPNEREYQPNYNVDSKNVNGQSFSSTFTKNNSIKEKKDNY